MFCNNCGKKLPQEANFCLYCGEKVVKLDNKKKCFHCGTELTEEAKFCYRCGNPIEAVTVFSEQPEAENQKLKCSGCGKIFDFDMVFCDECGTKLEDKSRCVSDTSESGSTYMQEPLLKLGLAECYEGEHALVNFKGFGKLMLYDDRMEFVSKSQQKKYFYKDMQSYSFGSFVFEKTLVLKFKNGAVESFAGGLWSNEKQEQLKAILSERVK